MLFKQPFLYAIALIVAGAPAIYADFYHYSFSGFIPDGASNHSQISDGEIWTAQFVIDSTTADTNPDPQFGAYAGAVVSGTLEFSGGYETLIDFAGANAFALNDVSTADSVSVRGAFGTSIFVFQANREGDSVLDSDALPGPGISFDSFPAQTVLEHFVFTFGDGNGDVVYFGNIANNVSFAATAIPEPSSGCILMASLLSACRRSRK